MPEREKIMDKQMMSMEELEQVNGGYKWEAFLQSFERKTI